MTSRLLVALAALACLGSAARAEDPRPKPLLEDDPHPLPLLAANPEPPPSIWKGLFVGSGVSVTAGKSTKGFVGGDVYAGYNRMFDNHVVLGIEGSTGAAPGYFGLGPIMSYNFAAADMKLGYNIGRFTPFVTSGLVLAKPTSGLATSTLSADYPNALFASPGRTDTATRVGAGFDYALTNNTSVSLGMSYQRGTPTVFP